MQKVRRGPTIPVLRQTLAQQNWLYWEYERDHRERNLRTGKFLVSRAKKASIGKQPIVQLK